MSRCESNRRGRWRWLQRALRTGKDERGATALEAALIGGLFCFLLFGAIELGRYYYTFQAVRTIVAEASRTAQINGALDGCATGNAINQAIVNRTALNPATLTVCLSRSTLNSVTTVQVNATYPFNFVVPFFGNTSRTLSENTVVVY